MELENWGDRWRAGQIGFHQPTVADFLAKYADHVWGNEQLERVLVPLCGKSLDMVFLAERAAAVVGVEYVEQAVEEFFAGQDVSPEFGAGPPRWHAARNYQLFVSDFFAMTTDDIGTVDSVFDRASLVALEEDDRLRYADHLRSLVPLDAKMLLITLDYDQAEMSGPPFAVPDEEVERLFTDGFAIEHLETRDALNPMFRARGLGAMTETAFALTRL